jgi:hypothetical protein
MSFRRLDLGESKDELPAAGSETSADELPVARSETTVDELLAAGSRGVENFAKLADVSRRGVEGCSSSPAAQTSVVRWGWYENPRKHLIYMMA